MLQAGFHRLWHSPTFTTWCSLGTRLASALLVLPIVLVRFPSEEVVIWQIFASLFTMMLLLDAGLSATFSRMIAFTMGGATLAEMRNMRSTANRARAADTVLAARFVSTLRWLTPRMALSTASVFALIGTAALVTPVARVADPALAWVAWVAVLAGAGVSFWGLAFTSTLQGLGAIAPLRRFESGIALAQLVTSLIALLLGGGLLALVLAYQVWAVVGVLGLRAMVRRSRPDLCNARPMLDRDVLATVWPASWRAGVGHLMGGGIVQFSGVAYSQIGSTQEVAAYLVALRAATVISGFSQAPLYSKLPRLAELQAGGLRDEQLRLAQRGMRGAHWVFVVGALTVAWVVDPLLSLIGSQTAFVSSGIWAVMALAFFMERFGAMHLQMYSLTNHIVWHIANGMTGVTMIVLALSTYAWTGPYAFPLAMLGAYGLVYCVYTVRLSHAAFGLTFLGFESRTFLPAMAALCAGLAAPVLLHVR